MANISAPYRPTTHTEGAVGDIFENTTTGDRYICTEVYEIRSDEVTCYYEWVRIIPNNGNSDSDSSDTYILVDENGTEIPAVLVENVTRFNATANDIRIGTVAVTDSGVTEGTKEIPAYHTEQGVQIVKPGQSLDIYMLSDRCQYTKLQAVVCVYASGYADSVSAEMVVLDDKLYAVASNEVLADVSVDTFNQTIKLGLSNSGSNSLLIRYMTIKEEA